MSDELHRTVAAARGGEPDALRELYRRCRPLVVRLLDGLGSFTPDEVDDVAQETFVRAFKSLSSLRSDAHFVPWLLTIARNRGLSSLSKRAGARRALEELRLESWEQLDGSAEALQLELDAATVRELIAGLPAGPEKETVQLFYVEGQLSARQIAERLGVGKSAVTMRLERFRARIKRELLVRLAQRRRH